jgi:hypothetical protein
VIEKGRAEEFNDVIELAVRPDGWLVRRADGETHGVGWGRASVGGTTTAKPFGPFMTRRITHGGVVSMLMANDASFRNLWGGGSQHRPDMAHKDAAAAVNIGNHLITLGLDGEILVAKKWTGEEHRPPEDFFKGARALSGIEDTYFSAKPGAVVQGWQAWDGTVTNFPAEIRNVIDIRAADKHVMFLTSSGRVFVTDQKGKSLSDEVGQVPGNIPLAIAIRIGRGMAAIQRMDGVWVAWGKSPELIEQTNKVGTALDLGFDYDTQEKSGLMLWVVPPNPFEKGSLAQVAGQSATSTPSSQTPKPATPTGDVAARMEQIEVQFQTAYERDILTAHKIAVADLDSKYLAAVNRALNAATQKGTLDEALKLREEAQRVRDKGRLPTADLDSVPETLKNLRGTYRASLAQLEQDRETKTKPYYDRRDQLLDAYQKELTQQQRLDDAVMVKSKRDELAASRFQPASGGAAPIVSAAPKPTPTPPAANGPAPMAIAPSKPAKIPKGTTKQSVIEWVYNLGGKVEVRVNDKKQGVHALADLPPEPFEVTLVSIGPGLKMDVTDDDFTMLSILPALEDVTAEGDRLKITSLAPLAGLSKLTKIHVQAKDGVAEKEILRLTDLKALDSLRVRLSDFSGEGFEALSRLPKLRTLRVHGNGRLSAKGAEAIASLTQLTSVQFPPLDRASQSRFAPIATLPALESIELDATSPGVELMRFIARLPKLTKLSFANPTDFNGPSFAALKAANGRLVELSFSAGADPKDESIKEIAAALPGLKIFNLDVPSSSCTVKGLKELAKLTNLQTLVWCEARDADYAALSGAPGLENLTVRGKGITDAAFAHFLDLPKLKTLKLVSSAATQAAADAFKKDRPGVTVTLSH